MIRYFVKSTVWRSAINSGKHALLGFVCCFFVVAGLLITSDVYAFRKGDRVVLQNTGDVGRYVRENPKIDLAEEPPIIPNGTRGTVLRDPVIDPTYTWYEVEWDTANGVLEGWTADIINGCPTFIDLAERADQKDAIVEKLFKGIPHEETNHDYNDFRCIVKRDGKSIYEGGHPGWDAQTKKVVRYPKMNFPFYSLTKGKVIRVGKIAHDFKTGKNYEVLDLFPPEKRNKLRSTLENDKTIAVYNPIDDKTTLYLHARQVFAVLGENIFVGNCLGIQGDTGRAFGVHVHIEVRDGEKPLAALGDAWADPPISYLYKSIMENQIPAADVNRDGQVDLVDAKLVAENIGRNSPQFDINGDGTVNIPDLAEIVKYLKAYVRDLTYCPAAPSSPVYNQFENASIRAAQVSIGNVVVSQNMVQQWLDIAHETDDGSLAFKQSIAILESLLVAMVPQKTVLFANYPNPFNPETWIPYYLATDTSVTISIYDASGGLVRQLDVGHQKTGDYTSRNRAAYWDGTSEAGERVASGIYFYRLTTDRNIATRKMVILK